jgi:hypothetical protein
MDDWDAVGSRLGRAVGERSCIVPYGDFACAADGMRTVPVPGPVRAPVPEPMFAWGWVPPGRRLTPFASSDPESI